MKKIIFTLALITIGFINSSAQDIITTKDGTDIQAKILEVTPTEVKYKKYNNLDGPIFTIIKTDILIVRYENGENEVFNNVTSSKKVTATSNYSSNTTEPVMEGMKYKELKSNYNPRLYVAQPSDPYSRGWAGVASFFIPGLGEGVAGEWGRGAIICLANIGLYILQRSGIQYDSSYGYYYDSTYYIAAAGRLGLNIWSICDAVRICKVKNMYDQYLRAQRASLDMKVEPFFSYVPIGSTANFQPTAGLTMKVSF